MINGKAVIKFAAPSRSPPADGLIHARARALRKTNARGFYDVPPFFFFFFFFLFRRILMTRPRKKGGQGRDGGEREEEKNRVILFTLSSKNPN